MGRIRSLGLAISLALVMMVPPVDASAAVPIIIANWSFEIPTLAPGQWTQSMPIDGWESSNLDYCGVMNPGGADLAADGQNTAWVQCTPTNSTWISQALPATLKPNYRYTLSLSVGHRQGEGCDPQIQLLAGSVVLINKVLTPQEIPAEGTHARFTMIYHSGADVAPGQQLAINLIARLGDRNQPHFDAVTLEASPHCNPVVLPLLLGD